MRRHRTARAVFDTAMVDLFRQNEERSGKPQQGPAVVLVGKSQGQVHFQALTPPAGLKV
ncbi:hypothetical protein ACFL6C_01435 [Myxococcota bacterium]